MQKFGIFQNSTFYLAQHFQTLAEVC